MTSLGLQGNHDPSATSTFSDRFDLICKRQEQDASKFRTRDLLEKMFDAPNSENLDTQNFEALRATWFSLSAFDKKQKTQMALASLGIGATIYATAGTRLLTAIGRLLGPISALFVSTNLNASDSFQQQISSVKKIERSLQSYDFYKKQLEHPDYGADMKLFYEALANPR